MKVKEVTKLGEFSTKKSSVFEDLKKKNIIKKNQTSELICFL